LSEGLSELTCIIHDGVLYTKLVSVRRNLNVSAENERKILRFRSVCLGANDPIDVDYTAALNMYIALGVAVLEHPPLGPKGEILDRQPVTLTSDEVTEIMGNHLLQGWSQGDEELVNQIRSLEAELEDRRRLRNEIVHSNPARSQIAHVKPDHGK
jgi:hypothetical protein